MKTGHAHTLRWHRFSPLRPKGHIATRQFYPDEITKHTGPRWDFYNSLKGHLRLQATLATWRNVAMGRGQFPNRVKSNQPYGRGLLTLNGTDPLPTTPDLFSTDDAYLVARRGFLLAPLCLWCCRCCYARVWLRLGC